MPDRTETNVVSPTPLGSVISFSRQNYLTILVGVAALAYSFLTYLTDDGGMAPLSTRNVIRLLLIGMFFVLLVFGRNDKYQVFRVTISAMVPISVVLILIYIWLDPLAADNLSREDKLIEDFSFLFPMVGTACLGIVGLMLLRKREVVTALAALLAATVFFVIGMEEVSWFQRVLDVESSEFFRNLNDQGEMNFHNMYTHESEDIYYLGGFLLLVLIPYFRDQFGKLLDTIRLSSARVLLPPFWLILPFVLAGSFVSQGFFSRAANVTIVFGSIIILLGVIHIHFQRKQWGSLAQAVGTLVLFHLAIILLLSQDFLAQNVRPWIGKEYQEFYISWGIAAYGVAVVHQYFSQFRHKQA